MLVICFFERIIDKSRPAPGKQTVKQTNKQTNKQTKKPATKATARKQILKG